MGAPSVEDLLPCAFCGQEPSPPTREVLGKREAWHLQPCCDDALRLVYKERRGGTFFFDDQLVLSRAREFISPFPSKAQAIHHWNRLMRAANAES